MLAAAILLAQASPSPAPTPLKTIVNERSTAFCTTFRENVAPAVLGLMMNDKTVERSELVFTKMGHDALLSGGGRLEMDRRYMEQLVDAIVHNFDIVNAALNDKTHFPETPKTQDDTDLAALRADLRAIEDSQRDALNVMNGVAETEALGNMQSLGMGQAPMQGAIVGGNLQGRGRGGSVGGGRYYSGPRQYGSSYLFGAGLSPTPSSPINFPLTLDPLETSSAYAPFVRAIADNRKANDATEAAASQAIVAASVKCGGHGP